ncbi:hypothetical protein L596_018768 [Steinernema carpocapsae]|uniref:Uncharacterized protein n=1 Tax=Steinernema carpocapsae TaxID=34508 RepID=A0A4U5N5N7_STECR|nr:hypothetical protein L596_018768 [Steinernema carpocapsae]
MEEDLKAYNLTEILSSISLLELVHAEAFQEGLGVFRLQGRRRTRALLVQPNPLRPKPRIVGRSDEPHLQGIRILPGYNHYGLVSLRPSGLAGRIAADRNSLLGHGNGDATCWKAAQGRISSNGSPAPLQCPGDPGYTFGCQFPGSRIYELVNQVKQQQDDLATYLDTDHEVNGWLSVWPKPTTSHRLCTLTKSCHSSTSIWVPWSALRTTCAGNSQRSISTILSTSSFSLTSTRTSNSCKSAVRRRRTSSKRNSSRRGRLSSRTSGRSRARSSARVLGSFLFSYTRYLL